MDGCADSRSEPEHRARSPRATRDSDIDIDPPDDAALAALISSVSPSEHYVDADAARDAMRRRAMFNVIDKRAERSTSSSPRTGRSVARSSSGDRALQRSVHSA
jgi:hypothetical protein